MRLRKLYHPMVLMRIATLLLCGCAAPKYSNKSFPRPKYEVRQHARNGTPSVAQRWWSRWWFWQRGGADGKHSIRLQ